ncbi:unnamed protein product [Brassica oleracea var. botrytis]|uniref:(rape) hypothetical protein n=2 Tax=Brassica napus TaxID=3708 RepID=A0A078JMP0_BRANA|nr:unnamed protein product [Brassica napus]CDY68084.1 BnaCnng57530D [Brassica napus]
MAIKYGGKYVDSFLKVFDFLEAHFQDHNELVFQLVSLTNLSLTTVRDR